MEHRDARRLLDDIGILRHACDLDLLVFFARHPRVLLASEALAKFVGYDPKDVARSLDALLRVGLLTRTQTDAHAARLYVFGAGGTPEWLPSVVQVSSSRDGRRSLIAAMREQNTEDATDNTGRA